MAKIAQAMPAHAGRRYANSAVMLEAAEPATRISLRIGAGISAGKVEKSVRSPVKPNGLKLPLSPKTSTSTNGRGILWLGPDEWMIIDENPEAAERLIARLDKVDCSAVDISHRNTAILVSGCGAQDVLNAGCPQNLDIEVFPVGACSRTVFGKVEIVLWRVKELTFRVEVWRSFSDYLWDYLVEAANDVNLEKNRG